MPHEFPHEAEDNHFERRKSDIFGEVRLYAPESDPSRWGQDGWLLMTQHGDWKVTRKTVERIDQDGFPVKVEKVSGVTVEDRLGPGIKVLVRADRAMYLLERTTHLSMDDLWVDRAAEVEAVL